MNFTVTQEEDIITVTVDLPKLSKDPETGRDINRVVLKPHQVYEYLSKSKIEVGECLVKDDIDNMGDRLTAVWKFKAPSQKKLDKSSSPVVSSNSKRAKKSSKP